MRLTLAEHHALAFISSSNSLKEMMLLHRGYLPADPLLDRLVSLGLLCYVQIPEAPPYQPDGTMMLLRRQVRADVTPEGKAMLREGTTR